MATLSEMKVQLQELQDQKPKVEKQLNDANGQYKIGLWGVLIGIFLVPLYGIGVLLILAGGLAALTNASKRTRFKTELEALEAEIRNLRVQIAEAEAQRT